LWVHRADFETTTGRQAQKARRDHTQIRQSCARPTTTASTRRRYRGPPSSVVRAYQRCARVIADVQPERIKILASGPMYAGFLLCCQVQIACDFARGVCLMQT
jgi:hypothetical protein